MSLQYVLDGYNVINQIPQWLDHSLKSRRERLAQFIDQMRPHGSARNKVTIVYDGRSGMISPAHGSTAKVIFSCDESADDVIKRLVAQVEYRKNIVVVTDDRDIRYYVRALGAEVLYVAEFLEKGLGSRSSGKADVKKRSVGPERKEISKTFEQQIYSEFSEIWLNKEARRKRT